MYFLGLMVASIRGVFYFEVVNGSKRPVWYGLSARQGSRVFELVEEQSRQLCPSRTQLDTMRVGYESLKP